MKQQGAVIMRFDRQLGEPAANVGILGRVFTTNTFVKRRATHQSDGWLDTSAIPD
jgi:hypothetical protein